MAEARGKWWKRLLLAIIIGPLTTIAGFVVLLFTAKSAGRGVQWDTLAPLPAMVFSIGGLTVGVLRKSLWRCLVGVNLGIALGLISGLFSRNFDSAFWTSCALSLCVLGASLNATRPHLARSILFGFIAGVVSLLGVFISFLIVNFLDMKIRQEWIEILEFTLPPFAAAYIFIWLMVDKLPKLKMFNAEPPFDPPRSTE
jgi:hypothetical protein